MQHSATQQQQEQHKGEVELQLRKSGPEMARNYFRPRLQFAMATHSRFL